MRKRDRKKCAIRNRIFTQINSLSWIFIFTLTWCYLILYMYQILDLQNRWWWCIFIWMTDYTISNILLPLNINQIYSLSALLPDDCCNNMQFVSIIIVIIITIICFLLIYYILLLLLLIVKLSKLPKIFWKFYNDGFYKLWLRSLRFFLIFIIKHNYTVKK